MNELDALVANYAQDRAPVTRARLQQADELATRYRSEAGHMRRHFESCLVDVFDGNGSEEPIREHAGLRLVLRVNIEDCDLGAAIAWMQSPPRSALKDRYRRLPDERLPRFRRPTSERKLKTSLLAFYRRHCEARSCPFISTGFGIHDLQAGASACRYLR